MRTLSILALACAAVMPGCLRPTCEDLFCGPGIACIETNNGAECAGDCGNGQLDGGEECDASAVGGQGEFCTSACLLQIGVGCDDSLPDLNAFCLQDPTVVLDERSRAAIPADMDQDGDSDIVHSSSNQLKILLNDGQGNFSVSSLVTVEGSPFEVADINSDGLLDIFVFNQNEFGDPFVSVVLQNPANIFTLKPANPVEVFRELADLNNDGALDFIASLPDGTVGIFFGDGQGQFSFSAVLPGALFLDFTVDPGLLQDWDGDGDLDLLTRQSGGFLRLHLNAGDGTFTVGPTVADLNTFESGSNKLDGRDWDNDGDPDLMLGVEAGGVHLLLNNAGTFTVTDVLVGPSDLKNGIAGDFNGDSFPDLAVVLGTTDNFTQAESITLFENNGAGQLIKVFSRSVDTSGLIQIQDFNSDGLDDVFFLGSGLFANVVILSDSLSPSLIPGSFGRFADFNGDGFLDRLDASSALTVSLGGND